MENATSDCIEHVGSRVVHDMTVYSVRFDLKLPTQRLAQVFHHHTVRRISTPENDNTFDPKNAKQGAIVGQPFTSFVRNEPAAGAACMFHRYAAERATPRYP